MRHFFRGATIIWIALRYGLDELVLTSLQRPWLLRVATQQTPLPGSGPIARLKPVTSPVSV